MRLIAALATGVSAGCSSALDCSLNGDCVGGACECAPQWQGAACDAMRFKPVEEVQGYGMKVNITSWGGGVLYDGEKYHLYVAAMTNDCPLQYWGKNSRVEHAVADSPTGPYTFADVAIDVWSHNPAPVALADGRYAIFHIGRGLNGPNGGHNCTAGQFGVGGREESPADLGSVIHVAEAAGGPWKPLQTSLPSCNNPAPWVHSNGTIFIVCGNSLLSAQDPAGPYTTVTAFTHSGGPAGTYEDPYLYVDSRGFHLLYHVYNYDDRQTCNNATVSAHAFSVDGFTWTMGAVQPYTTQIARTDGSTVTVSTRERPKMFFDKSGQMTHLLNAVCSRTECPADHPCVDCKLEAWDYTLVAPFETERQSVVV